MSWTYTTLQERIASFLHRDDLTDMIPHYIEIAEAQMGRRIDSRRMVKRATAETDGEFLAVPADYQGVKTMRIVDGTKPHILFITPEQLDAKRSKNYITAEPEYFTVKGGEFQFWPVPGDTYEVEITYAANIPALADEGTNWLLEHYPDVYLYGALTNAAQHIGADDLAATWGALFTTAIEDVNQQSLDESYGGPLTSMASLVI